MHTHTYTHIHTYTPTHIPKHTYLLIKKIKIKINKYRIEGEGYI